MDDKGFAIRCPHCRKWNVQEDVCPESVALKSSEELQEILGEFELARARGEADSFSHPKLWRCSNSRLACPGSFEAFVCRSEREAFEFLKGAKAWSFKRDFRLYRTDCETRWEGKYYGILFCTEPVPRLRHMELEPLMVRELLSRLIVGISVEIDAPATVFAAKVFEPDEEAVLALKSFQGKDDEDEEAQRIWWMPIEAYSSEGEVLVPPRFNEFCRTCRRIVMGQLEKEFRDKEYSVNNCPIKFGKRGKCAGKEAACMQDPQDWNHCPAFIEKRKDCPCYSSDLGLIERVKKEWQRGGSMENAVEDRCWANILEIAFPIVVHDHLVGVVMTGQVFSDPEEIRDVSNIGEEWDMLKGYESDLEQAKNKLVSYAQQEKEAGEAALFTTREPEFPKKMSSLIDNIVRITEMAQSRYRDFRGKSEAAFREEILGRIQNSKMKDTLFQDDLVTILERMREFWAFEGAYLGRYSFEAKELSIVAFAGREKEDNRSFGIPGRKVRVLNMQHRQEHPCPFVHIRGESPPRDSRLVDILPIMERIIDKSGLKVSEGDCECGALVPFSEEVYAFLFAVRDEEVVSILERRVPGGVSDLCQDAILETCTRVILAFGDVWYREAGERAWGEFSALASHRIGNEVHCVGSLLDSLTTQIMEDSVWAHGWKKRLVIMQQCIKRAKKMLTEQAMLTGETKPRLKTTSLENLVSRAAAGVLPSTAKLTVERPVVPREILVDRDLMEQAIRELCVNAVRAGGDNVELTVAVSKHANNIHISIRDNGPGIPATEAEEVFKPFHSRTRYGTGLGLSTVRHIIEGHGGSIHIEESKVGANFIISLPDEGE